MSHLLKHAVHLFKLTDVYGKVNFQNAYRCMPSCMATTSCQCNTHDDFKEEEFYDCYIGDENFRDEYDVCVENAKFSSKSSMTDCNYHCLMKRCPVSSCEAQHALFRDCHAEWAGCSCPPSTCGSLIEGGIECGTENEITGFKTGCASDPSICCSGVSAAQEGVCCFRLMQLTGLLPPPANRQSP